MPYQNARSLRRVRMAAALALAVTLPLAATACGGGGESGGGGDSDTIVIGTKFDQPGLGLKNPDGTMSGMDVDVATYVAGELGFAPDKIEWKESPSAQRETLIENDQVKFIAATYSITDARKEKVDFAGPYLVTGQSLLVRNDNTDITGKESLANNKKLCSVSGSTPAQKIKDEFPSVQLQQYDTYSACIEALKNGAVDAVTTDEVILAGYAAQTPGAFKIVGEPFSEENYGIGLKKGDSELRTKINDALEKMETSGAWKEAFDKNLGPAGITAPEPPAINRY
jgi:glutamate transport system substrate-binding protein